MFPLLMYGWAKGNLAGKLEVIGTFKSVLACVPKRKFAGNAVDGDDEPESENLQELILHLDI